MPRVLEIAIRRAVAERCVCVRGHPRRRGLAAGGRRPVPAPASLLLPAPTVVPPRAGRQLAGAAERRQARHPAVRRRLRGRARRADAGGRRAAGADRARDPRQGARRVGQPVRRRHDRADRLLVRLLRHGRVRRAADAGHRLPLPAVLPQGRAHRAGGPPAGGDRAARPGRAGPHRRRPVHAARAAAAPRGKPRRHAPADVRQPLRGRPQGAGRAGAPAAAAARCTRSTSPAPSTGSRPTTRCSPATSGCRRSGRRATCG